MPAPVVLVILDGWACAPPGPGNAIELPSARLDRLFSEYPHTTIKAGRCVRPAARDNCNSEVVHLTIGSGRVLDQYLHQVNRAICRRSFFENPSRQRPRPRRRRHPARTFSRRGCTRTRALFRRCCLAASRTWDPRLDRRRDCHPKTTTTHAPNRPRRSRPSCRRRIATVLRPLLRDGPRTTLGPDAEGLRHDREGKGDTRDEPGRAVRRISERGITAILERPCSRAARRLARYARSSSTPPRPRAPADAAACCRPASTSQHDPYATCSIPTRLPRSHRRTLPRGCGHGLRQLHAAETEK